MSDVAIKIENLSKQYRLGLVSTGTLSHDLNRWWHLVRGKEDPYLKVSETNDRAHKGESEYVWALKDIDLEVKQGKVLGIIGKNGAGKSTLLKILSRVTAPTTGSIKYKGRIGSLLEVGTGFHQELTGRENIFLNGAILGMTKAEVESKLDEIVDFSGVERYLDTPVKRYSSGMMVRLGFAVAAHLEPEILVVDEVLAVGDAEFQKRAIGKMHDVSSKEGRTVLFVSHNMNSLRSLCDSAILLKDGIVAITGGIDEVVNAYLGEFSGQGNDVGKYRMNARKSVWIDDIALDSQHILSGDDLQIEITVKSLESHERLFFGISVWTIEGVCVGTHITKNYFASTKGKTTIANIALERLNLAPGRYYLSVGLADSGVHDMVDGIIGYPQFAVTKHTLEQNHYGEWSARWGNIIFGLKRMQLREF